MTQPSSTSVASVLLTSGASPGGASPGGAQREASAYLRAVESGCSLEIAYTVHDDILTDGNRYHVKLTSLAGVVVWDVERVVDRYRDFYPNGKECDRVACIRTASVRRYGHPRLSEIPQLTGDGLMFSCISVVELEFLLLGYRKMYRL